MKTVETISVFLTKKSSFKGRKIMFFLASFVATGCFIGKIKYAPGTFGSLFAIIFCPYFILLPIIWQIVILGLLFTIGYLSVYIYLIKINDKNKDPKEVVIDEIIAVIFTSWLCQISVPANSMNWEHFLSIFVLFRFFDVLKPYPISWVDKNIHGANGIIFDDVLAGIASWIVFIIVY